MRQNMSLEGYDIQASDKLVLPTGSFESLYIKYYPIICRYLAKRLPTLQDAEDVAQVAFLELYMRMSDPSKDATSPKGLIYTIAQRRALDHFRSADFAQQHIQINEEFPCPDQSIESNSITKEVSAEVRIGMQSLPDISKTVLELVYFSDMRIAEAAVALGISEGAAKKRVFDAREILKEILSPVNQEA